MNDRNIGTCIICGLENSRGIKINSGFICEKCEQEIVNTEVCDEKYLFYINRMKLLWLKNA